MLSELVIERAFARLAGMKFFPGDKATRAGIAEQLTSICATDYQVDQLTGKFVVVYKAWEGVHELRACACSMFTPADGFEGPPSIVYPEGVPGFAELRNPALRSIPAAARRLDLAPGKQIEAAKQLTAAKTSAAPYTADPDLETLVKRTATDLNAMPKASERRSVQQIEALLYGRKREKI
jgi:hypothetical protein